MDFVCKLYGNTLAVHVTVALVGVATLNLALPAPPANFEKFQSALYSTSGVMSLRPCCREKTEQNKTGTNTCNNILIGLLSWNKQLKSESKTLWLGKDPDKIENDAFAIHKSIFAQLKRKQNSLSNGIRNFRI